MKFLVFLIALAFAAVAVNAQQVVVRTGEHSDFTRVVVFISPGADWNFERYDAGYVLRLPVDDGYDLTEFFDLIPRTRIEEVTQRIDLGELEFRVSCVCNADAYLYLENVLVIDFRDGPSDDMTIGPLEPEMFNETVATAETIDDVERFAVSRDPILPFFLADDPLLNEDEERQMEAEVDFDPADASDVASIFTQELSEALGVGLTGGFLDPIREEESTMQMVVPLGREVLSVALPGVAARTSIDPETQTDNAETIVPAGLSCLPERLFALQTWGDDRPFPVQIGEARAAIYDDRDQPSEEAITGLAQKYLFFGFGQEALQTLELDEGRSLQRQILSNLANLIDGRGISADAFADQAACQSHVSLWALLAIENGTIVEVARDDILQTFKALPKNVRNAIAPRLAAAFVRIGDRDASRQVLGRFRPASGPASEVALVESAFAATEGDAGDVLEPLIPVVATNTRVTPALLTQYFQAGVASGRQFSDAEFTLSDALRFEFSGSNDAVDLGVAQFHAYLSMHSFDGAEDVLDAVKSRVDEAMIETLATAFVGTAVDQMSDGEFGRYAWSDERLPASAALRRLIAQRLTAMGFQERASAISMTEGTSAPGVAYEASIAETFPSVALDSPRGEGAINVPTETSNFAELRRNRELIEGFAQRRRELTAQIDAFQIPNGD